MNYLADLLESYDRLKKRTFKIEFINEAGENPVDTEAEAQLQGILNNAPPTVEGQPAADAFVPIQDPKYPGLANFQYAKTRDGNGINVKGVAGKGGEYTSKVLDGGAFSTKPGAQKMIEAMYAAMRGEEVEKTPEQSTSEFLQQRVEELENRIGGTFEELGIDVPADVTENIKQSYKSLMGYKETFGDDIPEDLENLFSKPMAYLAGASKYGLEYKLANAVGISLNPDSGRAQETGPVDEGLIQQAAEAHTILTNFLNGEGNCDELKDRIGIYKGNRLVLFGVERTEGLTIQKNVLQNVALQKAEEKCVDDDGNPVDLTVSGSDISTNTKNSIKGPFYEVILRFAASLNSIQKLPENERRDSINTFKKEMVDEIAKRKENLRAIAESSISDVAQDLDTTWEREVIEEQFQLSQNDDALKRFLVFELASAREFISQADPASTVKRGTEGGIGSRSDTDFVYNDKAQAEAAGEQFGFDITDNDEGQFLGEVGQKRVEDTSKIKLGEINSQEMLSNISSESVVPGDGNNVAAGYYVALDNILGFTDTQKEAAIDYGKKLDKKVEKVQKLLSSPSTYVFADKIQVTTPEDRLKSLAKSLGKVMDYETLLNTAVGKAILKDQDKYRDFSDPRTQSRIAESLSRYYRFKLLGKDLPKSQAAKHYALRQLAICGANVKEMAQMVTDDSGESWVFSHNDVFKRLAKAKNLSITMAGNGVKFAGDGVSAKWSQEGTNTSEKDVTKRRRKTRSIATIHGDTLDNLNRLKPTQKSEDLFTQFLVGQQQLLDTLIQTRTNSLL